MQLISANPANLAKKIFDIELFLIEARAIITESVFRSRDILLQGKWLLGQLIENNLKHLIRKEIYGQHINEIIAIELDCSEREIEYIREFYRKFSGKDYEQACRMLPEGKNISWSKVKTHYLPASPHKECEHQQTKTIIVCCKCGKRITEGE